jgi:hypothetical protein
MKRNLMSGIGAFGATVVQKDAVSGLSHDKSDKEDANVRI